MKLNCDLNSDSPSCRFESGTGKGPHTTPKCKFASASKAENDLKKARKNGDVSSKNNYCVRLRPGHYHLSVNWSSNEKPASVTIVPECVPGKFAKDVDNFTEPRDHRRQPAQQPLLYENYGSVGSVPHPFPSISSSSSSSNNSSFPRKIVNRFFPSSSGGKGSSPTLRTKLGAFPTSRKRPGRCMENRSHHCQRKSKYRWASLSCIHFPSIDDDEGGFGEDFGGYEGVEHLKRTSLEEIRSLDDDAAKGPEVYFFNSFSSSQSLSDIYGTMASTAHVCKVNKVTREPSEGGNSSSLLRSFDALLGGSEGRISEEFQPESSVGSCLKERTLRDHETFLSQIVDEYFQETVPVDGLETLLDSCDACTRKRARLYLGGCKPRRRVFPTEENSVHFYPTELPLDVNILNEERRLKGVKAVVVKKKTSYRNGERLISDSVEANELRNCKNNVWCSEDSLGYKADNEVSDDGEIEKQGDITQTASCEFSSELNQGSLRYTSLKESGENLHKGSPVSEIQRRFSMDVLSLLNYGNFGYFSSGPSPSVPSLLFNFHPKFKHKDQSFSIGSNIDLSGDLDQSLNLGDSRSNSMSKSSVTASWASVSDIEGVLSKGLIIGRSDGNASLKRANSIHGLWEKQKHLGDAFLCHDVDSNSLTIHPHGGVALPSIKFPVVNEILIRQLGEPCCNLGKSQYSGKLDLFPSRVRGGPSTSDEEEVSKRFAFDNEESTTCSNHLNSIPTETHFFERCTGFDNVEINDNNSQPPSISHKYPKYHKKPLSVIPDRSLRTDSTRNLCAMSSLGKPIISSEAIVAPPPVEVFPQQSTEHASCSSPRAQGTSSVVPLCLVPSLKSDTKGLECNMGSALSSTDDRKSYRVKGQPHAKVNHLEKPQRSRKCFSEMFDGFVSPSRLTTSHSESSAEPETYSNLGCERVPPPIVEAPTTTTPDHTLDCIGGNFGMYGRLEHQSSPSSLIFSDSFKHISGSCQNCSHFWPMASSQTDSSARFENQELKCEKCSFCGHSYVNDDHNFPCKEFCSHTPLKCQPDGNQGQGDEHLDLEEASYLPPTAQSIHIYENSFFLQRHFVRENLGRISRGESCGLQKRADSCFRAAGNAHSFSSSSGDECAVLFTGIPISRHSTPGAVVTEGEQREFCLASDSKIGALASPTLLRLSAKVGDVPEGGGSTDGESSASRRNSSSSSGKFSVLRTESSGSLASDASSRYYTAAGPDLCDAVLAVTNSYSSISQTAESEEHRFVTSEEEEEDGASKEQGEKDCTLRKRNNPVLSELPNGFGLDRSESGSPPGSHEYVNANVVVRDNQIFVTIKPGTDTDPSSESSLDHEYESIAQDWRPPASVGKPPSGRPLFGESPIQSSLPIIHSDSYPELRTRALNCRSSLTVPPRLEKCEIRVDVGEVRIPPLRECLSDSDLKLNDDDDSSLYANLTISDGSSIPTSFDDISSLAERLSCSPSPDPDGHPFVGSQFDEVQTCHANVELPHYPGHFTSTWNRVDLKSPFVSAGPSYYPGGFSPPVSPVDAKKPPPFPQRCRESNSLPRDAQSDPRMRRRCRSVSSADACRRAERRRVVSLIKTSQESLHDRWFCPASWDRAPDIRWVAERKKAEGNELYKKKHYRDAIKLYTEAIEMCPDCPSYYSNRSACHMMLTKYSHALSDARQAVRLDASFVKGYIRVAKCNIALGDANAALSMLRQASEIQPGSKEVRDEIVNANRLIRHSEEIEKAATKKDYRTAIYHVDRALDLAVGCRTLRINKAEYLVDLQRHLEAQEIVNEILQSDSGNVDAICVRGMCLYYQDNQEAAFTHFQHALKLAPDHRKAKEMYKKAKLLKVKKEEGNQAFNQGKLAEALTLYTEALAIDVNNKTTNSKLYCNRAAVKMKTGQYNDAVDDCTAAINLNDKYVKAYLRRSKCYQEVGKHEEAVRDFERICKLDKTQEYTRLLQDAKLQLKCSKRKDYYKILGVSRSASDDDIKKSYKKMALQHHPDRHANASENEKREHEVKFKEIGEAYAVLTDPKKKAMYDRGQDINEPDYGFGHDEVDPNQIFQAFFNSAGSSFNFQQQGYGRGFPSSGFTSGGFPGGMHFQFG